MGQISQDQGQLFYSFNLEEVVPDDHLVRSIARVLDLSWVRAELAPHYSHTGRPSIDPVLMIRMLIVGYVFAIRSERASAVKAVGPQQDRRPALPRRHDILRFEQVEQMALGREDVSVPRTHGGADVFGLAYSILETARHPSRGSCSAFTDEEGNAISINPITAVHIPFSKSAMSFRRFIRLPRRRGRGAQRAGPSP